MSLPGRAAVAIWCDIAPAIRAEFEDWHSHEHMPERLAIPGFLRGSRWCASSGEPSYFILYELDDPATLTGTAYLARLNDPTPWSRRMMPEHRNMVRSVCRVRASFGGGLAQAMATVRLERGIDPERLAPLPSRRGITAARLLEAEPASATPQTEEQRIRGMDGSAAWVALVGGYEPSAVGEAARGLVSTGITGAYRLSYSLGAGEIG